MRWRRWVRAPDRVPSRVGRVLAGSGVASALCVAAVAGVASAHDVTGSRFDAPLPLSLLFAGAGVTVALTALWLAVADRSPPGAPRSARPVATIDARTARAGRALAAGLFGVGVLAAILAGVLGRQVAAENVATVFTWPVWFRGLALVAVVVGSPWPVVSPWRLLYRGLCRVEGEEIALVAYPKRLGAWPALAGFLLVIGVIENLTVIPRSPRLTAVVIAAYGLVMVGGAILFGPTWFDRADPLGVLYRLFGRVAPVEATRTGAGAVRVAVRPPWRGCRQPVAGPAEVAVVVAAVYTVSFDGVSDTERYQTVLFGVREAVGTGPATSVPLYLVGLAGFLATFVATVKLGDRLGSGNGRPREVAADGGAGRDTPGAALAFAPTVLPIAAAYDVAHNYPYVLRSLGRLVELTLAGTGVAAPVGSLDPLGWLSLPAFWGSQVLLVVVGHVVAVVAAHRVARSRYPSTSAARRGHFPLVVVMIGYTVLSLWIVSQPVVG